MPSLKTHFYTYLVVIVLFNQVYVHLIKVFYNLQLIKHGVISTRLLIGSWLKLYPYTRQFHIPSPGRLGLIYIL